MPIDSIASAPRLLIALDFDGVMAPLVDDPATSRITPAGAAALARLRALPDTWVAFVSGRPLDALAVLTESGPDALLVGSHGVEVSIRGQLAPAELSDDERGRLARLGAALVELVTPVPGAWLEHKPVGFGVPTRLVERTELVAPLQQAARDAAEAIGGFTTRLGKDIIEFSVRDVTKGDGVRMLRELLAAENGAPVTVLYAGDDVTDEDAFAVLEAGDLGVKVGQGETLAAERVADVAAFAGLLDRLATAREASVAAH